MSTMNVAPSLLQQLKAAANIPVDELPQDTESRSALLTELRKLTAKIQSPTDSIMQIIFQPHQNATIRTAIDLNLFELVGDDKDGVRAEELESMTGAESTLIVRMMRVLVAMGVIAEVDNQKYVATPISTAWRAPTLTAYAKHIFDEGGHPLASLPDFLRETGYRNPEDHARGPFQFGHDTDKDCWDYLNERPQRLATFNTLMEGVRLDKMSWFHYFPVNQNLLQGLKSGDGEVTLVDVGGGHGHEVEAFKKAFPKQSNRCVIQDQPGTIDEIKELMPGAEAMKHDFFTPQPIKGARAYYFRNIFHDWPDRDCRTILQRTAEAMEKGYSKLLINDWVLLDRASPLFPANVDMNMMIMLAGMERSATQWTDLLESAGLRIVQIHGLGPESESVIEAILA